VCCEELEEGNAVVLRSCKHVFCEECLDQISNQLCPFCRAPYGASDMIKKSVAQEATKKERGQPKKKKEVAGRHGSEIAPKVQALLDAMDEMMPDDKGVIFSQWTSYLDIVQDALEESGHTYTRIDGTMSAMERITAMEEFSSDSEDTPRFILCSLHACGTGINLTRGSWVFMLDCWWNYAAENQAMDRVHRIGQTRPVHVVRFIMQDSIEEVRNLPVTSRVVNLRALTLRPF
jgi:SWI/SNF-related matrix-associated actin-dependent regulator of chromatin subfamily A3